MMRVLLMSAMVSVLSFAALPALAETAAAPAAASAEKKADDIVWEERSLGDANAPVTIYEYASMTCGHCAAFHETVFPHVKSELIETGKVRFVYRDFPLNGPAVKAAALARCMPEQRFFPFVASVFKTQQSWIMSENHQEALAKLAALAGVDQDRAQACMNSPALEVKLMQLMQEAQTKYNINSTPSFVFYDKDGNQMKDFKPFTELMEKNFKNDHKH